MSIHFLFPKPAFSAGNNDQKDQDGDVDMFVRAQRDNFESKVVTPGQLITADTQYMRYDISFKFYCKLFFVSILENNSKYFSLEAMVRILMKKSPHTYRQ